MSIPSRGRDQILKVKESKSPLPNVLLCIYFLPHFSQIWKHVLPTHRGDARRDLWTLGRLEGDRSRGATRAAVRRRDPPVPNCCSLAEITWRRVTPLNRTSLQPHPQKNRPISAAHRAAAVRASATSNRGAPRECGASHTGGFCLACFGPPLPVGSATHTPHSSMRPGEAPRLSRRQADSWPLAAEWRSWPPTWKR